MFRKKECFLSFGVANLPVPTDYTCAICLGTGQDTEDDECKVLECGHVFHKTCIVRWLKQKKICPMCRRKVDKIDQANGTERPTFVAKIRFGPTARPPLSTYVVRMAEQAHQANQEYLADQEE